MTEDLEHWRGWIGRSETLEDRIDPVRAHAMQATLDLDGPALGPGDPLPPLWHWLYFWTLVPRSDLGPDGHGARGGFLPPVDLPRRMWAGSRFRFRRPLPIGAAATRRSAVADVRDKRGRSGRLVFVTVRHEIGDADGPAIDEEHDIVYREEARGRPAADHGEPAPADAPWRREVRPDPVLLFRYSALTFNGHRIHYDHKYVTEVEGYPGLVVHGPLLATLMVDLARRERPTATITAFEFRAESPIFDTAPFTVAGRPRDGERAAELWVVGPEGTSAMRGRVAFDRGGA